MLTPLFWVWSSICYSGWMNWEISKCFYSQNGPLWGIAEVQDIYQIVANLLQLW